MSLPYKMATTSCSRTWVFEVFELRAVALLFSCWLEAPAPCSWQIKALGQESQSVHPRVSISPSQLWEVGLWRSGVTWPGSRRSIALLGTERRSGSAHFYGFLSCWFRRGLATFSLLYSSGACWESSQDNFIPQQLLAVLHLCLKPKTNKIKNFGACSETFLSLWGLKHLSLCTQRDNWKEVGKWCGMKSYHLQQELSQAKFHCYVFTFNGL